MKSEYVIKTDDLVKDYGEIEAVKSLNLSIKQGEVYGFLGPNGAGKTTTIRMLLNFIFPTSGHLSVLGLDPAKSAPEIMKSVGYVAGEIALYPNYTVKDFLNYFQRLNGTYSKNLKSLVDRFDLDINRKISELSKGNRQKVAIVQAFMNQPKLLIMDEPTSGLDPLLQLQFYKAVKEAKDAGSTIFISSHLLSEVQRICDRVGIIRNGELISEETISELRQRNVYKVSLTLKEKGSASLLEDRKEVSSFLSDNGNLSFTYSGDINELLKVLGGIKLSGLLIDEPNIEDIFLHYYK